MSLVRHSAEFLLYAFMGPVQSGPGYDFIPDNVLMYRLSRSVIYINQKISYFKPNLQACIDTEHNINFDPQQQFWIFWLYEENNFKEELVISCRYTSKHFRIAIFFLSTYFNLKAYWYV